MERKLPPLNSLKAFEAAARHGSFSAAAEALGVTHGAISRQLQTLEDWVGTRLFDRLGRRVQLNDRGRDYLVAVQLALDGIAAATQRLVETSGNVRLVIDALPTFTMRWLLPRLSRFQQRHPGVELQLVTSERPLGQGEGFDVAVRRETAVPAGWQARGFLVERELPVCSPALRDALHLPADLGNHVLLESPRRQQSWGRWLQAAGLPQATGRHRQRFDHYYLVLQAAIDGLGVALGALPIIADDLAAGRLVTPFAGPQVQAAGYCWILPPRAAPPPVALAFCDWLAQEGAIAPPAAPGAGASG